MAADRVFRVLRNRACLSALALWVAGSASAATGERWYTPQQATDGAQLYQAHCASCHKADASGAENWRTMDAQGRLPPPPLNGTAHTWHHPLPMLRHTLRKGGAPVGGVMPGFDDKLDAQQIDAILAWVQSLWNDRIYAIWEERNQPYRPPAPHGR